MTEEFTKYAIERLTIIKEEINHAILFQHRGNFFFLCNMIRIDNMADDKALALKGWFIKQRPTPFKYTEIYDHPSFVVDTNLNAWWDWRDINLEEVFEQKVKFLELVIKKLQDD